MDAKPPSRREQAKDDRRNRIIDAAGQLIKEVGIDDLSVRMIAERAEVSPATVYNLFHSKAAVLFRLYQRRVTLLEEQVAAMKSADALERIFDSAAAVANLYRGDPAFYRAFIGLRLDLRPGNLPVREAPGVFLWRKLAREAVAAGDLIPQTDADRLGALLFRIIGGAFYEWIGNALPLEKVEEETEYSFASVLRSWATPEAKSRLDRHLRLANEASARSQKLRLVRPAE